MKPINVASFIDSNILIYAEASDEPKKQKLALKLLRQLKLSRDGVLSTQVLQEFSNVAMKKMGLAANHVRAQVQSHAQFQVVLITPVIILDAIDWHQTKQLSFWDALIVQAAIKSGCTTLYTEDLNAGQNYAGVRVVNPFAA
jgi:predicted nucleic acid-binding protein